VIPGETLPPVGQPVDPADPVPCCRFAAGGGESGFSDGRFQFRPQSPLSVFKPPAAT
jgi:hypothetical protein